MASTTSLEEVQSGKKPDRLQQAYQRHIFIPIMVSLRMLTLDTRTSIAFDLTSHQHDATVNSFVFIILFKLEFQNGRS